MSWIALLFGVPTTVIAFVIGIFIYRAGLKQLSQKPSVSYDIKEILILVIWGIPLITVFALYLGAYWTFAYNSIANDTFLHSLPIFSSEFVERFFMSIGISFLAATLNILLPFYGDFSFFSDTLYETVSMFLILLIINIFFSRRYFMNHYVKVSKNIPETIMFMQPLREAKQPLPARIGRVLSSKEENVLYYKKTVFRKIHNEHKVPNYIDSKSGEEYWITHCDKEGKEPLYDIPIEIDDDVRVQYWLLIREMPKKRKVSYLHGNTKENGS